MEEKAGAILQENRGYVLTCMTIDVNLYTLRKEVRSWKKDTV